MRCIAIALTAALLVALAPWTATAETRVNAVPSAGGQRGAPKHPSRRATARRLYVDVMVLHATNSSKGIDKRIGPMPELKSPPFSSYDSYQLLTRKRTRLVEGKPQSMRLPNRRLLQTKLLKVLPDDYVRLSAEVNQPGGKAFLPLLEVKAKLGQSFIVAGQSYRKGILVLVIRAVNP